MFMFMFIFIVILQNDCSESVGFWGQKPAGVLLGF